MQSAYFITYSHFFALFGNMIQDFRDVDGASYYSKVFLDIFSKILKTVTLFGLF